MHVYTRVREDDISRSSVSRVRIVLAGDDMQGSHGQITSSRMISVNKFKPEPNGFFAQDIFGPYVTNECACGKYSGVKNIGQVCDQCKVEITSSRVSRYRGAHIMLNVMVINPLVYKGLGTRISKISGLSTKVLDDLIYYRCYIVIASGNSSVKVGEAITEEAESSFSEKILREMLESGKFSKDGKTSKRINQLLNNLSVDRTKKLDSDNLIIYFFEDYLKFFREKFGLVIENGANALHKILTKIDFKIELERLKKFREENKQISSSRLLDILDRMRTLRAFIKNKFSFSSIFFTKFPVLPSGLRPAVKLVDDNSIVTSSLNNLYRAIFIANQRLQQIIDSETFFEGIINREKEYLQISIDRLFHGEDSSVKDSTNAPKSISQILGGKGGILRRECLGKRVDYSARSVIIPNPKLKMDQFGLPVSMALTLFFPFILARLMKDGYASNVKSAREIFEQRRSIIFTILKEVVVDHPCVLNRAPTLHRLGMQGAYVKLTLGNAIEIHPLLTVAFNADFDGDQMAVHLPLGKKAIEEVKDLMLTSKNIINPQNQQIINKPTQDPVLGIYCLTRQVKRDQKVTIYFKVEDLQFDYESGRRSQQDIVLVHARVLGKQFINSIDTYVFTTLGKILFNQIVPASFKYFVNHLEGYTLKNGEQLSRKYIVSFSDSTLVLSKEIFDDLYSKISEDDGWKKKDLNNFIDSLLKVCTYDEIVKFLDDLKDLGFEQSELSGTTISLFEIPELERKDSLVKSAKNQVGEIESYLEAGFYTEEEAYQKKIAVWANCKDLIEKELLEKLRENKNSSIYIVWNSGARSNTENLMQIFGMGGNVVDFKGVIQEDPIISSLREGLSVIEFLISISGAMKGMIDTSLKTAIAGYFARRITEANQSQIIKLSDCGTTRGSLFTELKEHSVQLTGLSPRVIVPFAEMIRGRFTFKDVRNQSGDLLIAKDTLILDHQLEIIEKHGIKQIWVRSLLECQVPLGVCQKCYGIDLSKQDSIVQLGTAVGIIAAQSLSEPGTQLTMRTFHTGGVSGKTDIVQGLPFVSDLMDAVTPDSDSVATIAEFSGKIVKISFDQENNHSVIIQRTGENLEHFYSVPSNRQIEVNVGDFIERGQRISSGKIDISQLLDYVGREKFREYVTASILKVYSEQGISINNKHVELFVKQMLLKVVVVKDNGDSDYLVGDIIDYVASRKIIEDSNGKIEVKQMVLGIKKIVNHLGSFLAGISFQNTYKSLLEYVIFQPNDYLVGLKENVIIGQAIPAGTTFSKEKEEKRV